jgi:hypothetical protein
MIHVICTRLALLAVTISLEWVIGTVLALHCVGVVCVNGHLISEYSNVQESLSLSTDTWQSSLHPKLYCMTLWLTS